MSLALRFRIGFALWFAKLFVPKRRVERYRHRTGIPALTLVRRYVVERNAGKAPGEAEPMPTRQPAQHRRSKLWD